jgi:hypothetical protein
MPKRALWVMLLVLLLVISPYVIAALAGGKEYIFGGFLLNPQDSFSYLGKMYQGWRGDLRFTLPFTSDPGEGGYLFLFYLFLGHLARWTGLSLIWVFHLARLFGAGCMFVALWRFLCATITSERWRLWAFTLACLGLGMGWLVFATGVLTSDFWVAEAYPFLSAYTNPHFPLSLALLLYLLTLPSSIFHSTPPRWITLWKLGVAAFFLSLLSPFGIVIASLVLGGLLLWEMLAQVYRGRGQSQDGGSLLQLIRSSATVQTLIYRLAWILVCGLPMLLYDLWIVRVDPQLAVWNAQNLTLTPPVWDVLLALSPVLLLALPGAWWAIKDHRLEARLLLVWVIAAALMIYAPFGLQRRFLMGLYAPLAALAGYGLEALEARFSLPAARRIAALTLVLTLPTLLLSLALGLFGVQTHDPAFYLTGAEAQALAWLDGNTPGQALVLAAPDTGLLIPAYTGRRVLYGHPYETPNAEQEKAQVMEFFQSDLASPADFLSQRGVSYIFYGPRERKLGALPRQIEAQPVYTTGSPGDDEVVIYRVVGAE